MKRFLDWLKAGGAEFSRLRVTTTARGGRGVVATAAFAPGDVLLRVPEPLLLTVDKAARRPYVAEALQRAPAQARRRELRDESGSERTKRESGNACARVRHSRRGCVTVCVSRLWHA